MASVVILTKPTIYLHVGRATHFLQWEIPEWEKHFILAKSPSGDIPLLSFGPDVLEEASTLPAQHRYAVLFPGFSHNPLHNPETKAKHRTLIKKFFKQVFINPGPLERAYEGLANVSLYPFSVDTSLVQVKNYRTAINSLLHVSNDGPQKDWPRSQAIMEKTGLKNEVYPPRNERLYRNHVRKNKLKNGLRKLVGIEPKLFLPYGYVDHRLIVKKYQDYDGFVHIARDIEHPKLLDGKYTASLIEAGLTGAILFWHDTYGLGNNLETVFDLPLDIDKAAQAILDIRGSIDVERHSRLTREEMLATFNPEVSVRIRAEKIINDLN